MTTTMRTWILRADATFLALAGGAGLVSDLNGAFTGRGPVGLVLRGAPEAALGFCEAHGLAVMFGLLFLRAEPERRFHLAAAAVHLLLGVSNVMFWQLFITGDALSVGYVTTLLHAVFVALQVAAFVTSSKAVRVLEQRVPG
jgi:hypothetical protein